jgi:hypothetical protein
MRAGCGGVASPGGGYGSGTVAGCGGVASPGGGYGSVGSTIMVSYTGSRALRILSSASPAPDRLELGALCSSRQKRIAEYVGEAKGVCARVVFLSGAETAKKLAEASAYGVVIEKNVTDLRAELHAAAA